MSQWDDQWGMQTFQKCQLVNNLTEHTKIWTMFINSEVLWTCQSLKWNFNQWKCLSVTSILKASFATYKYLKFFSACISFDLIVKLDGLSDSKLDVIKFDLPATNLQILHVLKQVKCNNWSQWLYYWLFIEQKVLFTAKPCRSHSTFRLGQTDHSLHEGSRRYRHSYWHYQRACLDYFE